MDSITIITIVVVASLTVIIFGLTWLAYSSCIKAYKMEVEQGKHDSEINQEFHGKKKKGSIVGLIASYTIIALLAGLFITGMVYKGRGENFSINNQTVLVIKTGSMSDFYTETYEATVPEDVRHLQFDVGDICVFENVKPEDELVVGEVYGYKYKNIIITHRLLDVEGENCLLRGDNNPIEDFIYVAEEGRTYTTTRDNIVYHYTGKKVPGLGAFILYTQSYFGIWSIVGLTGIAISSEVVYHKINKINKERDALIGGGSDEK
jgi:hypothetical protein